MLDRLDLEPLFFAPFVSSVMRVEPGWIDYNGHLNMAYYNVLFDRAVDEAYELIGIGAAYLEKRRRSTFTAEVHVRYLRELHAGHPVRRCTRALSNPASHSDPRAPSADGVFSFRPLLPAPPAPQEQGRAKQSAIATPGFAFGHLAAAHHPVLRRRARRGRAGAACG